jgi:hypothetical protein
MRYYLLVFAEVVHDASLSAPRRHGIRAAARLHRGLQHIRVHRRAPAATPAAGAHGGRLHHRAAGAFPYADHAMHVVTVLPHMHRLGIEFDAGVTGGALDGQNEMCMLFGYAYPRSYAYSAAATSGSCVLVSPP